MGHEDRLAATAATVRGIVVLIDMKMKKFDCVRMKRLGAAKVREQTANLSREQELRFWQERSQHLRQRQAALKESVAELSQLANRFDWNSKPMV